MSHTHYHRPKMLNARTGPGRGPAPAAGVDRWDWRRWAMWDSLLWDELEAMPEQARRAVLAAWPSKWPSPESGLLSIRQMAWARCELLRTSPPGLWARL